jgi:glutamyl-tRNA synthetase
MTVVTRFAPSPTGRLHVGNIRAAIHNWLWARKHGGHFMLRIDDTDAERSEERFVEAIRADLAWLGLDHDGEARQSERFDLYESRFEMLRTAGRVYACYETQQELELKRKIQLGRGLPPVYDRAALALTDDERATFAAEGRKPHWRFKLDHAAPIMWDDMIRGPQHFDPKLLSDPVVRRGDGSWLYLLPSVIDDAEMGVTHVVRGEDHVSNTATQIQMFAALGAPVPAFAHEALLVGGEGKLSKRLGALGVDALREAGVEPQAIIALLARIGTADPVEPFVDPAPLIAGIDFARFGRAPARFDEDELSAISAKIVHQLDYAAVADRLPADMHRAAWEAIRPNLATVAEATDWWRIVTGPLDAAPADPDDAPVRAAAAKAAGRVDWDADPWRAIAAEAKAATGRSGKGLFLPLRRALTGRDHGPDMGTLLPLIGREEAIKRLCV